MRKARGSRPVGQTTDIFPSSCAHAVFRPADSPRLGGRFSDTGAAETVNRLLHSRKRSTRDGARAGYRVAWEDMPEMRKQDVLVPPGSGHLRSPQSRRPATKHVAVRHHRGNTLSGGWRSLAVALPQRQAQGCPGRRCDPTAVSQTMGGRVGGAWPACPSRLFQVRAGAGQASRVGRPSQPENEASDGAQQGRQEIRDEATGGMAGRHGHGKDGGPPSLERQPPPGPCRRDAQRRRAGAAGVWAQRHGAKTARAVIEAFGRRRSPQAHVQNEKGQDQGVGWTQARRMAPAGGSLSG